MVTVKSTTTREDWSIQGIELYERTVAPLLAPEDIDKYVAQDIDTGDYEMDLDDCAAYDRLIERRPDARVWMSRAGRKTAYAFRSPR